MTFDDILIPSTPKLFQSSVWYEKYRPRTIQEMILPDWVKSKIKTYLETGGKTLPHLGLFSRTPGTGKSSLAKVIMQELKAESLWINASMDKGIDVLRNRIQQFASQSSLTDGKVKIVVMDEFDHFSKDGQSAFRGFIDQFGENVRFVFTGNYRENIIEPLLDRMEIYDFNQFNAQDLVKPIFERLQHILISEQVQYQREDLVQVIKSNFPKIRKMISDLGAGLEISADGSKTFSYLHLTQQDKLQEILTNLKAKNVENLKSLVYSLSQTDHVYGYFGEKIQQIFETKAEQQINAIIILAKYQQMHVDAKDKNLNVLACTFELLKLL